MSFRKPCHMLFHRLIPPFTLTEFTVADDYNLARNDRTAAAFSWRQIKLSKAFVSLLLGNFFKRSCEFFVYLKPFCKKNYKI